MFQLPFGPQIMGGPPAGPVAPVELPPGFRPPGLMGGGGLPSPAPQGGMSIGGVPSMGFAQANVRNKFDPESNISGFPTGGGPMGPSGGSLSPTQPKMPGGIAIDETGATAPGGGFFSWLKRQFI